MKSKTLIWILVILLIAILLIVAVSNKSGNTEKKTNSKDSVNGVSEADLDSLASDLDSTTYDDLGGLSS